MRIMYVAPRYHTNQIPIVAGWLKHHDEVLFITQKTNASENHDLLVPEVIGYSKLFKIFFAIYKKIKKCDLPDQQYAVTTKVGFPPYFKLKEAVRKFAPDIAILRERSVYTIIAYHICKKMGVPAVLYNQSPYYMEKHEKRDIGHWFVKKLTPQIRMTPVMGKENEENIQKEKVFYAPFVMYPYCAPEDKESFINEKVHIICVAGYHARKQIPMLLEAVAELKKCYNIELTVVGEVITEDQSVYYQQMKEKVYEYDLDDCVNLLANLNREQLFEQYKKSDLFVLPSTRERASISQLEAMSCSLPVICSKTNGSADQIKDGVNGFLFEDLDIQDLISKLKMAVSDKDLLLKMGMASYNIVVKEHNFELYYKAICDMKRTAGTI